jgi:hypothetical protein
MRKEAPMPILALFRWQADPDALVAAVSVARASSLLRLA